MHGHMNVKFVKEKTSVTFMLFPVRNICTVTAVKIQYDTFLYIFWCLWYSCLPTNSPYILDCCWSAMAESCWTNRKSSTLPTWSIPAMHPMWWVHKILAYMSLCWKMTLVMPPATYSKLSVRGVLFLFCAVTLDVALCLWASLPVLWRIMVPSLDPFLGCLILKMKATQSWDLLGTTHQRTNFHDTKHR
jgi:hypothetical protein